MSQQPFDPRDFRGLSSEIAGTPEIDLPLSDVRPCHYCNAQPVAELHQVPKGVSYNPSYYRLSCWCKRFDADGVEIDEEFEAEGQTLAEAIGMWNDYNQRLDIAAG